MSDQCDDTPTLCYETFVMWAYTSLFSATTLLLVLRHFCYVGRHVSVQCDNTPTVDPQFFPATLAFILWVSYSLIVLINTIRAFLGLVCLQALGGLICGPLSAYVVHFRVSSWLIFFSYWHRAIGSKWGPLRF